MLRSMVLMRSRTILATLSVVALATACTGGAGNSPSGSATQSAPSTSSGSSASASSTPAALTKITVQLSWLVSGENAGEQEAIDQGYFAAEGLDVTLLPGGPNTNDISQVAAGAANIGITSSSPALMLAASQGIPVEAFAVGLQKHPFAFISLPGNPVRTPQDLEGKTLGIQQSSQPLIDGLIAKNHLDASKIKIRYVGGDTTPLLSHQVDVITAWTIDKDQLASLGTDYITLSLWDTGVQLYALPYFATANTIQKDPTMLAAFVRALSKGWAYAMAHPQDAGAAVAKTASGLKGSVEADTIAAMQSFMFNSATQTNGWGTMDPAIWQAQIGLYDQLKQFKSGAPTVAQVMTSSILDATKADRMVSP